VHAIRSIAIFVKCATEMATCASFVQCIVQCIYLKPVLYAVLMHDSTYGDPAGVSATFNDGSAFSNNTTPAPLVAITSIQGVTSPLYDSLKLPAVTVLAVI
jgi:hypothetical protein